MLQSASRTSHNADSIKLCSFDINAVYNPVIENSVLLRYATEGGSGGITPIMENLNKSTTCISIFLYGQRLWGHTLNIVLPHAYRMPLETRIGQGYGPDWEKVGFGNGNKKKKRRARRESGG